MTDDSRWMRLALFHARQGLGRTAPNPSVGCVLVKNGKLLAAARTSDGGRPHAEKKALDSAGTMARGACAYVTLEPCSHYGQTPPCAKALIKAGIKRVVIGCKDEAAHVNGQGIAMLEEAGIEVLTGVEEEECRNIVKGFFLNQGVKRPFVTLKIATTLDGKIATKTGESQWITGPLARRRGHLERSTHDAILVGVGTVLADDPSLTCRLPGVEKSIIKVVLDSALRTPPTAKLLKNTPGDSVMILHEPLEKEGKGKRNISELEKMGAKCISVENIRDMNDVLKVLAEQNITRLLVEGGAGIHASFLKSGIYDRLMWFRSPSVMGSDGLDGVADMDFDALKHLHYLKKIKHQSLGPDILEIFGKQE